MPIRRYDRVQGAGPLPGVRIEVIFKGSGLELDLNEVPMPRAARMGLPSTTLTAGC